MKNNGFSLVEVLIAAGILVSAMIPLWGLLGSSHKQVTVSADEIRVSEIAASIIEQIENSNIFPDNADIKFFPKSGKTNILRKINNIKLYFPVYPEYLKLSVHIKITNYPRNEVNSGKLLKIIIQYSTKAQMGKRIKTYEMATYVNKK